MKGDDDEEDQYFMRIWSRDNTAVDKKRSENA